jgi:hypothetical protein
MDRFRSSAKLVSVFLTLVLSFIYAPIPSVFAAMVGTEDVLGNQDVQLAREKIRVFLERKEVQDILTSQGIDPLEAKARVQSLSDAEVKQVAAKIDQLPAGGGILGALILIAVVFFLVLLILDLLGYIDVFSFIHPPRK